MFSKKERRIRSKKQKSEVLLSLTSSNHDNEVNTNINGNKTMETKKIMTSAILEDIITRHREKVAKNVEASTFKLQMHYKFNSVVPLASNNRTFIFFSDLRDLIKATLSLTDINYDSRWCRLSNVSKINKTISIFVEDAAEVDYEDNQINFSFVKDFFQSRMSLINPETYSMSFEQEFFYFPNLLIDKNRSNFTIMDLILSPDELRSEEFALPFYNNELLKDFVYSSDFYLPLCGSSKIFAIDCEMVETSIGKELAWIAVVDENLECIYETYVKPDNVIKNYLTKFSGITKKILYRVATKLCKVQQYLKKILPSNAILVGHSLKYDLHALQMFHPYIIDTSVIYNLSNDKFKKPKLKELASIFLNYDIQSDDVNGHNPKEDAVVTMKLVKLKLQHGIEYGDVTKGWTMSDLKNSKNSEFEKGDNRHVSNGLNNAFPASILKHESNNSQIDDSNKIMGERNPIHNFVPNLSSSSNLFQFYKENNKKMASVGVCRCSLRNRSCGAELSNEAVKRICRKIICRDTTTTYLDPLFATVPSPSFENKIEGGCRADKTMRRQIRDAERTPSKDDCSLRPKRIKKSKLSSDASTDGASLNNSDNYDDVRMRYDTDSITGDNSSPVDKKENTLKRKAEDEKKYCDDANGCKLVLYNDDPAYDQDLLVVKLRMPSKSVKDDDNNTSQVHDYAKLDKNIKDLLQDIPSNSFVLLIFNGTKEKNGKCFIKLTD